MFMARFSVYLVVLLAMVGCAKQEEPPVPKAPPVEVLAVRLHQVVPRYEYVGRVEATDEFKVRPRVEGYIESRNFIEGQLVQKGELLYVIDPKPYVAALENQRANLAQAHATLANAERNYRRGRELVATGAISKVDMDELTATFETAQSQVAAMQANVEAAQLNLNYTEIHAPLTGIVGRSEFTDGSLVGPNSEPLTSIVRMDPIYVTFQVPEDRLFAVQEEAARREQRGVAQEKRDVRIKQPDGNLYPYPGLIVFVDNQIDQATGSAVVRARFPNPEALLVQGQFARVVISVFSGKESEKPLVPQSAVQEDMQGRYVYVVSEDSIAHKRYLKLGQREGELWAVDEGLKAGERIVVNGLQRVVDGAPVAPQNPALDPYKNLKVIKPPEAQSPVPQIREGDVPAAEQSVPERDIDSRAGDTAEPDAYFDGK